MDIIGHRGARAEAPENTLFGFAHLRKLNINQVEFDLRLSADNELMIIHDDTLERTSDGSGEVIEQTAASLGKVNTVAHFNKDIKSEGVPNLEQVLAPWTKLQHAQLEVKPPLAEHQQIICEGIEKICNKYHLQEKCVITSSDHDFLKSCQQYVPHFNKGIVFYDEHLDPIETCQGLNCQYLCIYWKFCTQELIARAHDNNILVSAWTVNHEEDFQRLRDWNIDSIITDKPSTMINLV